MAADKITRAQLNDAAKAACDAREREMPARKAFVPFEAKASEVQERWRVAMIAGFAAIGISVSD